MKYGIEIFVLYMTREKGNYLKNNEPVCVCVCVCVHSLVGFLFWVTGEPVIRLGDSQATQPKGLLDLWDLRTMTSSFYSILMSFF